jgi:hypothetical protein
MPLCALYRCPQFRTFFCVLANLSDWLISIEGAPTMKFALCVLACLSLPSAFALRDPDQSDIRRASNPVPRNEYKGKDFKSMVAALNGHLQTAGLTTKACHEFEPSALHELLRNLFPYSATDLLDIYTAADDNRQRLENTIEELEEKWAHMNHVTSGNQQLKNVYRDGLCHQTVMWFVHHLSAADQAELKHLVTIPLLPLKKHTEPVQASKATHTVLKVYNEHSTCQAGHTAGISNQGGKIDPPLTPSKEHPTWARLRRCDEPCTKCDVQYKPDCGPCEGTGGPYFGDQVDDFTPVNCSLVGTPDQIPPAERMSPLLPKQFQVYIQGTDRLVRKENPVHNSTKTGAYSNIHGTMWYDWGKDLFKLRHDTFYDSEPYKTFAKGKVTEIHQQTTAQMDKNITGSMFSTIAAMSKLPAQGGCTCVPDPVGVPRFDAFADATYMGRVKLDQIEYLNKTVIVDHYSKWFFHLFVDAEKGSETYGLPLRFYSPYAGFAVYHTWILEDPEKIKWNVWNDSLPATVDKCMNPQKDPVCNSFNPVDPNTTTTSKVVENSLPAHHKLAGAAWPFKEGFAGF